MSSSQTLGGSSRAGRIIGPSLDKIIKNVAWRKHSNIVASCKSALDKFETITEVPVDSSSSCSIYGLSLSDAEAVVAPLLLSLESGSAKVVEPALECIQKLFSFGIVQGEIFQGDGLGWRLVEGVCKFGGVGDDGIEISVLRVLVAAATSTVAMLRGECLVDVVKSLYNLYLGSHSAANQVCAKAVLVQIMLIVCGRVDADRMDVRFKVVSIVDILDLSDKSLNDSSIVQFAQNFINEVMGGNDVENLELKDREVPVQYANGSHEEGNMEAAGDGENVGGGSKIRDDGLFLFRNLCKFSMKFSTQDNPEDHLLLRGKILSLELLKTVVENAGQIWRSDDK